MALTAFSSLTAISANRLMSASISQKAVLVEAGDTPETLQRRVMEQAEWLLLPRAVEEQCALWEDRFQNPDFRL